MAGEKVGDQTGSQISTERANTRSLHIHEAVLIHEPTLASFFTFPFLLLPFPQSKIKKVRVDTPRVAL